VILSRAHLWHPVGSLVQERFREPFQSSQTRARPRNAKRTARDAGLVLDGIAKDQSGKSRHFSFTLAVERSNESLQDQLCKDEKSVMG
jgi:hypothetical protein